MATIAYLATEVARHIDQKIEETDAVGILLPGALVGTILFDVNKHKPNPPRSAKSRRSLQVFSAWEGSSQHHVKAQNLTNRATNY